MPPPHDGLQESDQGISVPQPSLTDDQYPVTSPINKLLEPDRKTRDESTAFWNVNISQAEQTAECPDYLRYAFENDKDREILATPDDEYQRQTWQDVQEMMRDNRLDLFMRVPSDLRLYREYCAKLVREYGSIMAFVMKERLQWTSLNGTTGGFGRPDNYRILYNDWPYGIDERIVHLVVWTKFELPADTASEIGDMSTETRKAVEEFVDAVFVSKCGRDNVVWFKNWASLKSIHAVEHFHVMLFDPDMDFVRDITGGDVPLFMKVKKNTR